MFALEGGTWEIKRKSLGPLWGETVQNILLKNHPTQEGGDVCILMADSPCTAETNMTLLRNCPTIKVFLKIITLKKKMLFHNDPESEGKSQIIKGRTYIMHFNCIF